MVKVLLYSFVAQAASEYTAGGTATENLTDTYTFSDPVTVGLCIFNLNANANTDGYSSFYNISASISCWLQDINGAVYYIVNQGVAYTSHVPITLVANSSLIQTFPNIIKAGWAGAAFAASDHDEAVGVNLNTFQMYGDFSDYMAEII
jgi:hypothetical protein